MKKVIVGLLVAVLLPSYKAVLADVTGVSGSSIIYVTDANSVLSTQGEVDNVMSDSRELFISVLDQLVIKGLNAKTSFTPLAIGGDASLESIAAAVKILNLKLPIGYLQTMSLYQSFNGSSSIANNVCEFLILHELLNEQQNTKILKILTQSGAVLNDRGGFYSFDCERSGAGA